MPEQTRITPKFAAAVAHPLRFKLLGALAFGPRTVASLASELETNEPTVMQNLEPLQALGMVGAEQHTDGSVTYEVLKAPVLSSETWGRLPLETRRASLAAYLTQLSARAQTAVDRGGFDRPDIHLTRRTFVVTEERWTALAELFDRWHAELCEHADTAPDHAAGSFLATGALVLHTDEVSGADVAPTAPTSDADAHLRLMELTEALIDLPIHVSPDFGLIESLAEQVRQLARAIRTGPTDAVVVPLRPDAADPHRLIDRDERIERRPSPVAQDPESTQRAIVDVLLDRYPAPTSVEELTRRIGDRVAVRDAVSDLRDTGLADEVGNLVWLSSTGRHFATLMEL